MNFWWHQFRVAVILSTFMLKVIGREQILQVQLVSYNNPFGLEYRSNEQDGPYCCCENSECSGNISSAPECDPSSCDLLFTICANVSRLSVNSFEPAGECYQSMNIVDSPSNISFLNAFFPDHFLPLVFNFTINPDTHFEDINITVLVHDTRPTNQILDPIDEFTLAVDSLKLKAPPQTYTGLFGIANVTLGYVMFSAYDVIEDNCTFVEPVPTVETTTILVETTLTSYINITNTVTETFLQSPPNAENLSTSPVWFPVASALIVVAALAVVGLVIMIGLMVCVIKRSKKMDEVQSAEKANQPTTTYHEVENDLYMTTADAEGEELRRAELQYSTIVTENHNQQLYMTLATPDNMKTE